MLEFKSTVSFSLLVVAAYAFSFLAVAYRRDSGLAAGALVAAR